MKMQEIIIIARKWGISYKVGLSKADLIRAIQRKEGYTACFLIDIDYGQWQGLTPAEAKERWPEVIDAWYNAPHTARIPGGETLDELHRRAMSAVNELVADHQGETIVLVGHTVINRIILLGVLGLGHENFWRIRQDTCAINVFELNGGIFTIVTVNDTCHLRQPLKCDCGPSL